MLKNVKDTLVALVFYTTGGTCFILWAFIIILISVFHTGVLFDWALKTMSKTVLFCCGIRVSSEGEENIDPTKQYIVMMNHVNIFDLFVAYSRYPGKGRGVEEESHFKMPLYGWLVKRIGMIPINRKSGIKAMNGLRKAADLIRKRKDFSVAILPEGTRTRSGKLGNFKKGGFLLAMEAGLEIVPMIQVGAYEIKKQPNWKIRPGKIRFIIEKPISTREYTKDNVDLLINKTRDVFLEYLD
jgi:1-acyl-sn-glycerol-3-phosphate acyltransferase